MLELQCRYMHIVFRTADEELVTSNEHCKICDASQFQFFAENHNRCMFTKSDL